MKIIVGFIVNKYGNGKNTEKQSFIKWSEKEVPEHDNETSSKNVLFLDVTIPRYDTNAAAKVTLSHMLVINDLGYNVTFIPTIDPKTEDKYTLELERKGINVIKRDANSNIDEWLRINAHNYSIAYISRPFNWDKYGRKIIEYNPAISIIYFGQDLHYLRNYRRFELTGDPLYKQKSEKEKTIEFDAFKCSDCVLTLSEFEKKTIDLAFGDDTATLCPMFFYQDKEDACNNNKSGLLFVGGFNHNPNVDGVLWFVQNVFPLVEKRIPNIQLTIAGYNPSEDILNLESSNIHITGYLTEQELDSLYEKRLISIVPLRYGAGVKGKVMDAMYHRMHIVSTSIGLEGLPDIEKLITPKNTKEQFAEEIIRICTGTGDDRQNPNKYYEYVMERHSYPVVKNFFEQLLINLEREKREKKNIMIITTNTICPPNSGGSRRIVQLLKEIDAKRYSIDVVFSSTNQQAIKNTELSLNPMANIRSAKGVLTQPYGCNDAPRGIPREVWETMTPELYDYVCKKIQLKTYDIIQIESSLLSWIVPIIRKKTPKSKIVLDSHKIEYRLYKTWLEYEWSIKHYMNYIKFKRWEESIWHWYDSIITMSPVEESILKSANVKNVVLTPVYGCDNPCLKKEDSQAIEDIDILFIGTLCYYPNIHGVEWFISEVLPLIKNEIPFLNFTLTGFGKPNLRLEKKIKSESGINYLGRVESLNDLYQRAKVLIVPVFIGAGSRVIIIDAWSAGIPVVSTSFGAEGYLVEDGDNIMLADTSQQFAQKILALLRNQNTRSKLIQNGYNTVKEHYSLDKYIKNIINLYEELSQK